SWKIDASVLIDRYGLSGNRRLGEVSFEPYENIRKGTVGRGDDEFLDHTLARIDLRAHGIHTHADEGIAGELSGHADLAFDRAGVGLCKGISRAGNDQANDY